MRTLLLPPLCSLLLLASATAQTKVGQTGLEYNDSIRSVNCAGTTAFVSRHEDGVQYKVDLSNPTFPWAFRSWNPTWGDQWAEAVLHQGRLISGHRGGGLNLWQVSGAPRELHTLPTNDHHDGLAVFDDGTNRLLFFSESDIGGFFSSGGLRIFDIGQDQLNQIGTSIVGSNQRDGRFLVVTDDLYVYQLDGGNASSRPLTLNVYDASVPTSPVHLLQYSGLGTVDGNFNSHPDAVLSPDQQFLYIAAGFDGLKIVDISNRVSPQLVTTIGVGYNVHELDMALGTAWMVASIRDPFGTGDQMIVLDCSNPVAPKAASSFFGDPGFIVKDLEVVMLPQGVHLLVGGQDAQLWSTLQVWR